MARKKQKRKPVYSQSKKILNTNTKEEKEKDDSNSIIEFG